MQSAMPGGGAGATPVLSVWGVLGIRQEHIIPVQGHNERPGVDGDLREGAEDASLKVYFKSISMNIKDKFIESDSRV